MIARSSLVRKSYPDAIAVPIFSILSMENQRYVMLEKDGIAWMRPIEVGVLQGNSVQVVKGLESGDRLIVAGQRDIQDGEPVKVVEVVQ
jgi:membrane fusion protein (multidrug efflux system)